MDNLNRKRTKKKIQKLAVTSVLASLIIVMSFTPLGYLKIGQVVSITFIPIPVVIGAIVCGPSTGASLGAVFGITSFIQCFGMDPFGTTLMSINPFFTAVMCLVPRIITGLASGYIYKTLSSKIKNSIINYGIASLSGGLMNTALFVAALLLLFINTEFLQGFGDSVFAIIGTLVTVNAVIEWIACLIIGTAAAKAISSIIKK